MPPVCEKAGIDLPAQNGDDTFSLPVPTSFVIDSQGATGRFALVDGSSTKRVDPEELIDILKFR